MKSKMSKKLIAFILCMVLVICNSVSILADTPAPEATTAAQQTKTAGENSDTKKKTTDGTENVSAQSEDSADAKKPSDEDPAPEVKTTEEKKETTEVSTEKKEDSTVANEEKDDPAEVTTKAKADTDKTDEPTTETMTGEQDETKGAEESSTKGKEETDGDSDKKDTEKGTEEEEKTAATTQSQAYNEKYEDETVTISVSAEAGIVPEGAELSVTPIVKTEITDDMSEESRVEAEQINAQYDLTEKKLTEDSEANEETMEGFLAYDISFLVNGEEVEPSGDVKVVMDFKEAAIPEGVSETADVSVKHLKEDVSATDGVVVEDMSEKADVQTTDKAEVEKVEFTTDSFSSYTLYWSVQETYLEIQTVDRNGEVIGSSDGWKTINTKEYGSTEVLTNECAPEINGYKFLYAYVEGKWDTRGKVNKICYYYNKNTERPFTLKTMKGDGDYRLQQQDILKFVYAENSDIPQAVPTNSENIDINLYNYNSNINSGNLYNAGFGFYASTAGRDGAKVYKDQNNNNINYSDKFTNNASQGLKQDIVKKNLNGGIRGIPQLNDWPGTSMEVLFPLNSNKSTTVKNDLTGLFQLDADGYYTYDSELNGAVLEENEVKVYDTTVAPDFADYGNFLPFNSDWLNKAAKGVLYNYQNRSDIDLWFGMNIGMTFYQPESGKIHGDDMIFEFSGDDDVWVFIDGVLVLDLGGIHDRLDGTINFSTGNVDAGSKYTTLRKCYEAAYKEKNPRADSEEINEYLNSIFDENGKYLNYSDHRLEFFYLERGGGAANCRLKFNMPSLPDDGITVSKVIDNYDEGAYTDVEFQFELYVDQNEDGVVEDNEKVTGNMPDFETYTLKEIGSTGQGQTIEFGDDGIFTLRHNQMATFENLPVTTKYKVKEIGVSYSEYDNISISSGVTDVKGDHNLNSGDTDGYAETIDLEVGTDVNAVFHNSCNPTNMKRLYIKKELSGTSTSIDNYRVQVKVGGSPYIGDYFVGTNKGSGTKGSTKDGWIDFQAGQIITVLGNVTSDNGEITGFPSDTTFEVVEDTESLDSDKYNSPTYSIESGTANIISTDGKASGKFVFDSNAEVTITNILKSIPIDLVKYGSNYNENNKQEGAIFKLYQGNMNEEDILQWGKEPLSGFETVEVFATGNPELLKLSSGYYKLVETTAPTGYQLLDEEIYFKVQDGYVTLIDGEKGNNIADNKTAMWEIETISGTITIKIKNDVLYSLPSAGGPGIYWYTLSGTLLMAGAALIVYRQKRKREVLLKK